MLSVRSSSRSICLQCRLRLLSARTFSTTSGGTVERATGISRFKSRPDRVLSYRSGGGAIGRVASEGVRSGREGGGEGRRYFCQLSRLGDKEMKVRDGVVGEWEREVEAEEAVTAAEEEIGVEEEAEMGRVEVEVDGEWAMCEEEEKEGRTKGRESESDARAQDEARLDLGLENESLSPLSSEEQLEATVREARNRFGDTLPEDYLTSTEFAVYKRLYGKPTRFTPAVKDDLPGLEAEDDGPQRNILLKEGADGTLEEVEYVLPGELDQIVDDDAELEEEDGIIDTRNDTIEDEFTDVEDVEEVELEEFSDGKYHPLDAKEVVLELDEYATEESLTRQEVLDKVLDEWPGDEYIRTHPFTKSGRYGTNPSTLHLPRAALVTPVQKMLAPLANKHLIQAAKDSLGGIGIPDSPNTPRLGRSKEQVPIPISSFQSKMSEREADVYMAAVMPQTYASLMSVLVEVRKRLGGKWLQNLLAREGGPLVMDAGAGGAGVLAWREILRAEWEGMHKFTSTSSEGQEQEHKMNSIPPVPFGRSTVVTGSDQIRHRTAKLLENTTFIPRIPDQVDPGELVGPQPRKLYDIILAPHTLWPINEDYQRKGVVQTLWSLLNPNGGVLIILEKGVPRGFEVIAGARDLLLKRHISSPGSESYETPVEEQNRSGSGFEGFTPKETGCIIAPCTNHLPCPLYKVPGVSKGRKDWCYFQQRYVRPPTLMTVLQAKARNHDDVDYSYVAVQRGVDQRSAEGDSLRGKGFVQGSVATGRALDGYGPSWGRLESRGVEEEGESEEVVTAETNDKEEPHPLTLPRAILPPLKRKGHILIDVCTPSGTLERWFVNKRNGKQIYRDARKAKWGDLWALGARSATEKRVKLGDAGLGSKKEGIKKERRAGVKGLGKRGLGKWSKGEGEGGWKKGGKRGGNKKVNEDGEVKKGVVVPEGGL